MSAWPLTDMHVHATHYRLDGAKPDMTVSNIVRRLEALGCASAGIVEHLDTNPKHPLACLEALVGEFRRAWSASCALFVGAELDYQDDAISIPTAPEIKERLGLDYYLAAAHGVGRGVTTTRAFIDDHHRRLMGIVECCPYVDVVAHPWAEGHKHAARGLIEAWDFAMIPERYLREFVQAAAAHGKAIEINRKVLTDADAPAFHAYLERIRSAGVRVSIGSDAHSMEFVGCTESLSSLLRRAGFPATALWRPERDV